MSTARGSNRRSFLERALYGLWTALVAGIVLPAVAYIGSKPKRSSQSQWVDAGDVSLLPVNQPKELTFIRTIRDGWKVRAEKTTAWVLRRPDGSIVAFAPQCTHLGCAYHWNRERNQFICPCHNSVFAPDGRVLEGPAPRPLDSLQVKVEGTRLWLGQLIRSGEQA